MGLFSKFSAAVSALVILTVLIPLSSAQEERIPWTELIFKGSKFLTSTMIKIKLSSEDQVEGNFSPEIGADIDDCFETVNGNKPLRVQSSSRSAGVSQNQYEEKVWFDETTVSPTRRIRFGKGDSPWEKIYCWEDRGIRRLKKMPGNHSETKQPVNKWTKRTTSFYEYPEEAGECAVISDPSLIFYILSAMDSGRQGEPFEICVFGKKQLHRITIAEEKSSRLKVSYKARLLSGETTVEGNITPVVFSVTTQSFAPDDREPEIFSLFGLNRDIRIYMDQDKRLPVRVSGTNDSIGRVVLNLRRYSN